MALLTNHYGRTRRSVRVNRFLSVLVARNPAVDARTLLAAASVTPQSSLVRPCVTALGAS